jgi:hypothetical protein
MFEDRHTGLEVLDENTPSDKEAEAHPGIHLDEISAGNVEVVGHLRLKHLYG